MPALDRVSTGQLRWRLHRTTPCVCLPRERPGLSRSDARGETRRARVAESSLQMKTMWTGRASPVSALLLHSHLLLLCVLGERTEKLRGENTTDLAAADGEPQRPARPWLVDICIQIHTATSKASQ